MEDNDEDVLFINAHQSTSADDTSLSKRTGKLIKTIVLYASFIALGLYAAITGPTLPYLQDQVGSSVEKIGVIFTGRSVGYLTGAMGAGWMFDRFGNHHDLMFAVGLLMISLTAVLMPWATSLVTLSLLNVSGGLASGGVDTGGNAICLRLWGPRSPPYMQALHFSYGVGAMLAPLIAAPFLGNKGTSELRLGASNETNFTMIDHATSPALEATNESTSSTVNVNTTSVGSASLTTSLSTRNRIMFDSRIDNVQFVYVLVSSFSLSVALAFAAFEVRRHSTGAMQKYVPKDPTKEGQKRTDRPFLIKMLVLLVLFYCFYSGLESCYGHFIATFAIEHAGFSENDASLLTAVFFGVFTLGRGCAVFVARHLSPTKMLIGSFACAICALSFLCFALSWHPVVLWVFSGILGFGFSAIFPTGFAWAEEHLHVSGKVAAAFMVGSATGEMALPATLGYLIANVGSIYMMYAILGLTALDVATFLLMCLLGNTSCRSEQNYSVKGAEDIAMRRLDRAKTKPNEEERPASVA